jgi:hypothetical protein
LPDGMEHRVGVTSIENGIRCEFFCLSPDRKFLRKIKMVFTSTNSKVGRPVLAERILPIHLIFNLCIVNQHDDACTVYAMCSILNIYLYNVHAAE